MVALQNYKKEACRKATSLFINLILYLKSLSSPLLQEKDNVCLLLVILGTLEKNQSSFLYRRISMRLGLLKTSL